MSDSIKFEMRKYTRLATEEERSEQVINLLSTMTAIETKKAEAKTKAAEFKAEISSLVDREDDLRIHLEAGTFLEGVEVHAVVNEMSGNTEYYDREGNEVVPLRHPTSKQEKRNEAAKRQMSMFGEEPATPNDASTPFTANDLAELGSTNYQSFVDAFEANAKDSEFEPQEWAVGDLSETPDSQRFIVLTISTDGENIAEVITDSGAILFISLNDIHGQKYSCGLEYDYTTREEVEQDWNAGLFTPFFAADNLKHNIAFDDESADVDETDSDVLTNGTEQPEASTLQETETFDPAELDSMYVDPQQPGTTTEPGDSTMKPEATTAAVINGQPMRKNGKKPVKA
ncbi:hypothetical protein [Fibrella forsythiae]|uniref:Uncharacterized protein n=1 Tax=Fibrella forsythiae TaxID=2817061 RepID=A0ABS3JNA8_9BACT|nr:hypothetical protein [Fibrella forsythiae]MBO0950896.1 hypothetical protein [Fibrella forsythiae]